MCLLTTTNFSFGCYSDMWITVLVWYVMIIIIIILEYDNVIISDKLCLYFAITIHRSGNYLSTPGHTNAVPIS